MVGFGPGSDIDVLVECGPEARVGFFGLFDMEQELSVRFVGRKAELNAPIMAVEMSGRIDAKTGKRANAFFRAFQSLDR